MMCHDDVFKSKISLGPQRWIQEIYIGWGCGTARAHLRPLCVSYYMAIRATSCLLALVVGSDLGPCASKCVWPRPLPHPFNDIVITSCHTAHYNDVTINTKI